MLTRVSSWIRTASTGRVALAAAIVFVAFVVLVLPRQASGGGGSPDTSFAYSTDDLYTFAEAYGAEGRQTYVRARLTFDVIWPVVYVAFLCSAISWLFQRGFPPGSAWQSLNVIPLLGVLFDFLENLSTSVVMLRYPARSPLAAALAPPFTLLKWLLIGGSFLLLVAGAVASFRRRRSGGPKG